MGCCQKEALPLHVVPLSSYPQPTNRISTTKYHPLLFLPATLIMQFTRLANLYFLATAIIQSIPQISPLEPFDAVLPLALVLLSSLIRESIEEWAKYRFDKQVNAIESEVWQNGMWTRLKSEDLRVGMICRIHDDEILPADMIALKTSKSDGVLYLETSGLDGEKALKNKYVSRQYQELEIDSYSRLSIKLSEPDASLYIFEAESVLDGGSPTLLGLKSFLYRGSRLKNSQHILGLIVYVGAYTKTMLNSCKPQNKMSWLERRVNVYIVVILVLELLLITVQTVLVYFTAMDGPVLILVNQPPETQVYITFIAYFILLNTMIPISLIISLEVIKSVQGYLISHDELMTAKRGEDIIASKTFRSALNEELGMVQYVFTDKTGTLTRNEMVMKELLIGGRAYITTNKADDYEHQRIFQSEQIAEDRAVVQFLERPIQLEGELLARSLQIRSQNELIELFLFCLSMCHECVLNSATVGLPSNKIEYEGSSPDQIALVDTARWLGWVYQGKSFSDRLVLNNGREQRFEVLDLFEFDSDRKRMTIVLKYDSRSAIAIMKGADNIVKQRLAPQQYFLGEAERKVLESSIKGLRTLFVCFKLVELQQYERFHQKVCNLTDKDKELKAKLVSEFENDMILIGATSVEDRLQDKVPETIRDMLRANIKVCMLTGDKLETAENIARSCNLITPETQVLEVRELNPSKSLINAFRQTKTLKQNNKNKVSLIVEGTALAAIVNNSLFHTMLELCDSVVCCRVTPADKASVVKVARDVLGKRTLAIGDGANDVEMISHSNVGIGLYGNEGMSAVQASDYALPEFKALWRLLFVHGRWNYLRIAEMVKYFFYKNMVFTIPQFCYGFYQAYSGASLYIGLYLSLFNTIFTCAPVVVQAVLEQDVNYLHYAAEANEEASQLSTRGSSLEHPMLHPQVRVNDRVRSMLPNLYVMGQQNLLFTHSVFALTNLQAIFCAVLIYFTVHFAEPSADYMTFTLSVYTSVMGLVTVKLCFQVQYWTWLLVLSILLTSLIPYVLFNYVDSLIESSMTYNSFTQIFSQPDFYLVVLVTTCIVAMLSAIINLLLKYFRPTRIDRARKQMIQQQSLLKTKSHRSSNSSARTIPQEMELEMVQLPR